MSGFQLLIFWKKSATKELVIQETEFKDEKRQKYIRMPRPTWDSI